MPKSLLEKNFWENEGGDPVGKDLLTGRISGLVTIGGAKGVRNQFGLRCGVT